MQEYKNRVEAILFTTGRFMDTEEISRLCGIASIGMIKEIIEELKKDYETKQGALELLEENGRYKLNIRKQYGYLTTKLLSDCELDRPTQETLAIIAYKNPALQSEVIKIRGTTAYDHIKFLKENGFVISEKQGRTRLLKLAPKFFDYFDVVEESLKAQFDEIDSKLKHEEQETLKEDKSSVSTDNEGLEIDIEEPPQEESSNNSPRDEMEGIAPEDEEIN
ncbi:MAG: SMC-Scp complex subunit ScpB [archaeon]